MSSLNDLAEMIADDPELVPEIVAVDARVAMKISTARLGSMLDRANAVIPAKEVVPGTAYARLDAVLGDDNTANSVTITASDGVQTLQIVTDMVSVSVPGVALLPAKRIIDVLRLAPEDIISMVIVGTAAVIRSGRAQWTIQLPTTSPSDTVIPDASRVTVPREAFLNTLIAVGRALPTFNARPALHQVNVANGLVTAADGSRVHREALPVEFAGLTFAIPARGLDQVLRMLRTSRSADFEIGVHDTGVVFGIDADVLSVQRLAVPFPDVEKLLLTPAIENTSKLTVEPKALIDVVKRVRLAADAEYASIILTVVPEKKVNGEAVYSLAVSAKDRLGNSSAERIGVQWTGPVSGHTVCVNHKFLTELLVSIDSEFVTLRLGADSKTVKKPVYVEDKALGFVGMLVQMRSDWLR